MAFWNHARTRFIRGDRTGALESIAEYRDRYPGHIYQPWADLLETMAVGEVGGLDGRIRALLEYPDLEFLSRQVPRYGAAAEISRGRLAPSLEWADEITVGLPVFSYAGYFSISTGVADVRFWILDDPEGAVEALRSTIATSFDAAPVATRPWGEAVSLYAMSGRTDLAQELLARWEAEVVVSQTRAVASHHATARAMIDMAEGRLQEALGQIEIAARDMGCPRCFEQQRAIILERLERYDEAISIWEMVRDYPADLEAGGFEHVVALKRLGPIHEQAGDTAGAIAAYQAFAAAWANADAELQPQVTHARQRITALGG